MSIDAQELKSRLNITRVAEDLGIVRKGKSWHCFNQAFHRHGDRHPSLSLSEGLFHCFACGVKGDVIQLWMQVLSVSFTTALEELAQNYAPDLIGKPSTAPKRPFIKAKIQERPAFVPHPIFETIYRTFQEYAPLQASGYHYLRHIRGFSDTIIRQFRFFEVTDLAHYQTVNQLLKSKFSLPDLTASGLFNNNGNLIFGSERLIIPFYYGEKLIYLQSRYIGTDPNIRARYINLSGIPYPLFNAEILKDLEPATSLKDVERWTKIVVCEGVFNAISWMQMGQPAVACGSASKWNYRWVDRYFKGKKVIVYLNFDDDPAGLKAYEKDAQGQFTHALTRSLRKASVTIKKPLPFPASIKDANDYLIHKPQSAPTETDIFALFDKLTPDSKPFLTAEEL